MGLESFYNNINCSFHRKLETMMI